MKKTPMPTPTALPADQLATITKTEEGTAEVLLKRFGKVNINLDGKMFIRVEIGKVKDQFHVFVDTGVKGKTGKGSVEEPGVQYLLVDNGGLQVNA